MLSATSMIHRRFQRSTRMPTSGPKTTWGSKPTREAIASTVAEPVLTVGCQIGANWTNWLPKIDNACPPQIVKKGAFQDLPSLAENCVAMRTP